MQEAINRRREARIRWWTGCTIRSEGEENLRAYALDLSLHGLSVLSSCYYKVGAPILIQVVTFPKAEPIELSGRVVRVQSEDQYHLLGIELLASTSIDPAWRNLISNADILSQKFPQAA